MQEELQQELQEDEFDDGLFFDVDSNDSDNDEIEDNTSIASAKRPGLRYILFFLLLWFFLFGFCEVL